MDLSEIEVANHALREEIRKKRELLNLRGDLVSRYESTVRRMLKPDVLYELAESLCAKDEVSLLGDLDRVRLDILEAAEEQELILARTKTLHMLHFFAGRGEDWIIKESRRLFSKSCSNKESDETLHEVLPYFDDVLIKLMKLSVRSFFHHTTLDLKRKVFGSEKISEMEYSYRSGVILGSECVFDWVKSFLFPRFSIQVDECWSSVFFENLGYAEVFIRTSLYELIFNALKYSDYDMLSMKFSSEISNGSSFLTIEIRNTFLSNESIGTQIGIDGLYKDIRQLNNGLVCFSSGSSGSEFFLKFGIDSDLFDGDL